MVMSSHWDLSDGEQEAVETITDNTTKKESKKQSQLKKDLKQKKRKSQGKVTDTQDAGTYSFIASLAQGVIGLAPATYQALRI